MQRPRTLLGVSVILSLLLVCSVQAQDVMRHHSKLASPNLDLSSNLIGAKVENQQGNSLGTVTDLMMDPQSGRVPYAILSRGGMMGVGAKLYPIPWQAGNYSKDGRRLVINLSEDRLSSAPSFARESWPDLASPNWREKTDSFYETQGAGGMETRARPSETANKSFVRVSQLKDKNVYNADGQRIGTIADLVIDTANDDTHYIVLGRGGVMGLGETLHPVPWDAVKYNPGKQSFTVDATKDKIDNSPGFTRDKWPDMSDPAWKAQVDRYYGVQSSEDHMDTGGHMR